MKLVFVLFERSSNFPEQIFVIVQYFVSFMELSFGDLRAKSQKFRKNLLHENFCPQRFLSWR